MVGFAQVWSADTQGPTGHHGPHVCRPQIAPVSQRHVPIQEAPLRTQTASQRVDKCIPQASKGTNRDKQRSPEAFDNA